MRPKHGVSALRLLVWDVTEDATKQPVIKSDETIEAFHKRSNEWHRRKGETARLIHYLEHRNGNTPAAFLAKTEFLADMVCL